MDNYLGPRLEINTEVIVKSRVQLSSTDMLRLRKGHLSSFRPAAGDLIQYLFLHLLKDIATSPFMKFTLLEEGDEEEDVNQVISPPQKKRKVTDKQKQAMKNLSGFLSGPTSSGSPSMGEGTIGGEDHRGGDDDGGGAGSGAGTKKKKSSKKKKQAAVKVTPFTPATAHTPAVEKRIKTTGAGKGGRKPTKR